MSEDRKKMLEALVAKRKAEAESGEKNKRHKAPSLPAAKPAKKPVNKPAEKLGSKAKPGPTSVKSKHKEVVKPKRSTKLDRYETDEDEEEEEEEDFTSESGEEDELSDEDSEGDRKAKSVKKPSFESKGKSLAKGSLNGKGKDDKGKGIMKDKGKNALKTVDSSSEDGGSDDDDGGDLSDDPLNEVDPSNILPSRTRRRASQPGAYQFTNVNDDDDDDDDDDDSD